MAVTGKDHARVNLDIWNDDSWLDLTPPAQHLYLVLWTSAGLSYCGAGEWKPGKIAQRARGWSGGDVESAGAELSRELFIIIDVDTEEFLLRSWVKHDGLWRTPNMAVSMANARADLASRTLRGVVVHEVAKIRKAHPDSSSWKRIQVANMLTQKPVDPSELEPLTLGVKGRGQPIGLRDGVNPRGYQNLTHGVNPTSNPAPTPAPAPTSCYTTGGYVSGERYDGDEFDPDNPPQKFCDEHPQGTDKPCRACGRARECHEAWESTLAEHRAEARRREQAAIAAVTAAEIAACGLCDERGYRGRKVCNHDPDEDDRAKRGIALVREALSKGETA